MFSGDVSTWNSQVDDDVVRLGIVRVLDKDGNERADAAAGSSSMGTEELLLILPSGLPEACLKGLVAKGLCLAPWA